jgi:hypothetical protein
MIAKSIILVALLSMGAYPATQSGSRDHGLSEFMGRAVTIAGPERADTPASVCLEGLQQRQCYTAPQAFGIRPTVTAVQVEKDVPALLFSAASAGTSGWEVHFALLRSGLGGDLENLFEPDLSVSNQSQHAFWSDPVISDAQIFVTADFIWGPNESHYSGHRYIISAYVLKEDFSYFLEDRYMTARKYYLEEDANILASEKREIIARLGRLKGGQR